MFGDWQMNNELMICDTDRSPSSDCSLTDFVLKKVNLTYSN